MLGSNGTILRIFKIDQKITNHFANHLKDENTSVDDSVEWIQRVFQLETTN